MVAVTFYFDLGLYPFSSFFWIDVWSAYIDLISNIYVCFCQLVIVLYVAEILCNLVIFVAQHNLNSDHQDEAGVVVIEVPQTFSIGSYELGITNYSVDNKESYEDAQFSNVAGNDCKAPLTLIVLILKT